MRSRRLGHALLLVLFTAGCSAAPTPLTPTPLARTQSTPSAPTAVAAVASGPIVTPEPATGAPIPVRAVAPEGTGTVAAEPTVGGPVAAPTQEPVSQTAASVQNTEATALQATNPGGASAALQATNPGGAAAVMQATSPGGAAAAVQDTNPGAGAAAVQDTGPGAPAPDAVPTPDPSVCDGSSRPDPLPAPGSPRSPDFFRSFRTPLPPAPLYDPPGQRRVGLQAGHWLNEDVPPELGRLQGGAVGGGKQEWQVNLDVAQRTAAFLQAAGIQVDVLPATIPPGYRANAFIALHADGDPAGQAHGFKVARPGFSSLPDVDDRLVETLNQVYGADTELPRDDEHISLRMRYYYAFNSRRYCHAVAPGVPQAIIEMAYLTSAGDRQLLIGNPDRLAGGLADAIETFLNTLP